MIMGQEIIKELGLDIKFLECTMRRKSPGTFEGLYAPMKDFKQAIDTDLNSEIISVETYDGNPVMDMTDHAARTTSVNYNNNDF